MPYSAREAVELGQCVLDVYTLYQTQDPSALSLPPGYSLVDCLYADDIADGRDDYVLFGYVASYADDLVVAIRGTEGVLEWIWDFDFGLQPFRIPTTGDVERGFAHFYDTLRTGPTSGSPRLIDSLEALFKRGVFARSVSPAIALGRQWRRCWPSKRRWNSSPTA